MLQYWKHFWTRLLAVNTHSREKHEDKLGEEICSILKGIFILNIPFAVIKKLFKPSEAKCPHNMVLGNIQSPLKIGYCS